MRIFEHNFVAGKAKIRRRAVARQEFFTQDAAKFAEKTLVYACEDRFLFFIQHLPQSVFDCLSHLRMPNDKMNHRTFVFRDDHPFAVFNPNLNVSENAGVL